MPPFMHYKTAVLEAIDLITAIQTLSLRMALGQ